MRLLRTILHFLYSRVKGILFWTVFLVLICSLQSCSFLSYRNDYLYKDRAFSTLQYKDTVALLFTQFTDYPKYRLFTDTLLKLMNEKTFLNTVSSDVIINSLMTRDIYALPLNNYEQSLEALQRYIPYHYLLTVSIEKWAETEMSSPILSTSPEYQNRSGNLQMRFTLFDMRGLKTVYMCKNSMEISVPASGWVHVKHGFNDTGVELVHDTFNRELKKIFPIPNK